MLHEVVNVVGPLICGAIIVFQGFKYRQLKKYLEVVKLQPETMGYLFKNKKDNFDTIILTITNTTARVQYGVSWRSATKITDQIYFKCPSILTVAEEIPTQKDFLKQEKRLLIEERKKLLLMEESLAKKEQAIIEMEVQQELDS